MDIFSLGGVILDLLQTVVDFWNDKVSLVFELLGQSPVSFKNGGPWAVVANLEPIFVAVGSSLVVLFFVIGFCSESIDVKEEVRFETILRMLMRIGIAECDNNEGIFYIGRKSGGAHDTGNNNQAKDTR